MPDKLQLSPAAIASRPLPGVRSAISPAFTPDGGYLYYLWADNGVDLALHRFDLGNASDETILGAAGEAGERTLDEELRRERLRLTWEGLAGFELYGDANMLVINRAGRYAVLAADSLETIADFAGDDFSALKVAPGGTRVVGAGPSGLYSIDLGDGSRVALAQSQSDTVTYGLAEYVAQEELDRLDGFWINPGGTHVAFAEVDETMVAQFPILHLDRPNLELEHHRYPFAGEPNASVRLGVTPVFSAEVSWIPIPSGEEFYLCRVLWLSDSRLVALTANRLQDSLSWWLYDLVELKLELIHRQEGQPWVNLPSKVLAIGPDAILATGEASGYSHLCRIGTDGSFQEITSGNFSVTSLVAYDRASSCAYLMATKESPLSRHLYRVPIATGAFERLSREQGVHDVEIDPGFSVYLDQFSSLGHGATVVCRSLDSDWSAAIGGGDVSAVSLGLRPPELFSITASNGDVLHGAVYLPSETDASLRPGVVSVYGGPHAQVVTDSWALTIDLQAQYLASQGVVVVKLDNRGSYGRGLGFEAHIARNLGTIEVQDQLLAVGHMVANYAVDPSRIGIYGWSYGGFMTVAAMLQAPEVFKVGVAGAPVVDFRFYDTAYTERYMGLPEANRAGYEHADLSSSIGSLEGSLLIIHGLIDENVHFRHTVRLIDAAIAAGREIDLDMLPHSRHSPRGFETLLEIARRRSEFLLSKL